MIQIWQVPSECGPSNLVVLGLVHQFLLNWFWTPSMVHYTNISCSLVYFELFQILGAFFKHYKVTSKQMDKYLSSIKAQKLKVIKKPLKYWKKNLDCSFTYCRYIQTLFSIFFFIFILLIKNGVHHQFNKNWWTRHKSALLMNI